MRAFHGLGRFEPGTEFGKWLRGIARHLLQETYRRRAREARAHLRRVEVQTAERMAFRLEDDSSGADSAPQLRALAGCVESLEPGSRDLLQAHYQRGQAPADIARQLGSGLSAIRMKFLRLRRILRRCVDLKLKEATP